MTLSVVRRCLWHSSEAEIPAEQLCEYCVHDFRLLFAYLSYRLYVMIISDKAHFVNRFLTIHINFIGFISYKQFPIKKIVHLRQKRGDLSDLPLNKSVFPVPRPDSPCQRVDFIERRERRRSEPHSSLLQRA